MPTIPDSPSARDTEIVVEGTPEGERVSGTDAALARLDVELETLARTLDAFASTRHRLDTKLAPILLPGETDRPPTPERDTASVGAVSPLAVAIHERVDTLQGFTERVDRLRRDLSDLIYAIDL